MRANKVNELCKRDCNFCKYIRILKKNICGVVYVRNFSCSEWRCLKDLNIACELFRNT